MLLPAQTRRSSPGSARLQQVSHLYFMNVSLSSTVLQRKEEIIQAQHGAPTQTARGPKHPPPSQQDPRAAARENPAWELGPAFS